MTQFARDLLAHLRQLIVIKTVGEAPDSFAVTAAEPERLRTQAESLSELTLARSVDALSKALADIREGDEPRMTVELAVLRCARPSLDACARRCASGSSGSRLRCRWAGGAGPGDGVSEASPGDAAAPEAGALRPGLAQSPRRHHPTPSLSGRTTAGRRRRTRMRAPGDGGGRGRSGEAGRALAGGARAGARVRVGLLSQILSAARPVAVDVEEAMLEVGFPASAAFNKRKAEDTEARDRFADAVKTIVGERLRPVYVLLDADEAQSPRRARR